MTNSKVLNDVINFRGKLALTVFWLSLLVSCGDDKAPPGILSKSQMTQALIEFYLKEARVNAAGVSADSALALMKYYQVLYNKQHAFADSAITESYQYYLERPKELDAIYDVVIDSLALREQKANRATTTQ